MPGGVSAGDNGGEGFELHLELEDPSSPALYRAICVKDPQLVLHVIQHSSPNDVAARNGHSKYTYMHLLIMVVAGRNDEDKCLSMVYQLSNAGIDVNAADTAGITPLHLAITKGLSQIMVALIRCGVDLCNHDYIAAVRDADSPQEAEMLDILDKYQPGLWAAVGAGSTGIVNLLVNSWCRINIYKRLPTGNMSLLMYAQRGRQPPELITLLDDYEVTIEFVHATLAGDEIRMQDFLMDSKPCDPYIMDISYQENSDSPLIPRSLRDAAIAMGHTHVLHLLPEGDYDSGQMSRINTKDEGNASCSDYSSGSNPDSIPKTEPLTSPIEADTQFMTIGRAPRFSTFRSEPITTAPDRHYVQGFFFHKPDSQEEQEQEEEQVFQGFQVSSPQGTVRGAPPSHPYGFHDYSKNWESVEDSSGGGGGKKPKKDRSGKTKSKLCVIM